MVSDCNVSKLRPQDLRIGNWFTVGESKPIQITGIFKEWIWALVQETDFPISDVKPIPLTEEWLLRFGFRPLQKDFAKKGLILHSRKRGFVVRKSMPIIKYVHQLQNLFFALTGDELVPTPAH